MKEALGRVVSAHIRWTEQRAVVACCFLLLLSACTQFGGNFLVRPPSEPVAGCTRFSNADIERAREVGRVIAERFGMVSIFRPDWDAKACLDYPRPDCFDRTELGLYNSGRFLFGFDVENYRPVLLFGFVDRRSADEDEANRELRDALRSEIERAFPSCAIDYVTFTKMDA